VDVAAIDLATPTISHFYLAITSRCSVPNHKMIGEAILHSADMAMIIIEDARISLPCPAVVHDNELPASSFHGRAADLFDDRPRKIAITFA